MTAALARDPDAVLPLLVRAMEAEIAAGDRSFLPWPAMIAPAANDRDATLRLLGKGGRPERDLGQRLGDPLPHPALAR